MKTKILKGKKLNNKLDDVVRHIFKAKYGENPRCFVCGHMDGWWNSKTCPRGIQVGHYIARGRTVLRWDLDNLFPQCSSCNIIHNTNPAPFTMAIMDRYGKKRIAHLNVVAKEAVGGRVTDAQKRDLLDKLTEYLHSFDKPIVAC